MPPCGHALQSDRTTMANCPVRGVRPCKLMKQRMKTVIARAFVNYLTVGEL